MEKRFEKCKVLSDAELWQVTGGSVSSPVPLSCPPNCFCSDEKNASAFVSVQCFTPADCPFYAECKNPEKANESPFLNSSVKKPSDGR